jgi:Outer membrane protein beta-barrel domain
MKKSISFLTLLFVTTLSFAQLRFGVQAGLNQSSMVGKGIDNATATTDATVTYTSISAFKVGGFVDYSIVPTFSLEAGLFLSGKGAKGEAAFNMGSTSLSANSSIMPLYIEIPLNAVYKANMGGSILHLFAGPYVGFGVGGKIKTNSKLVLGGATTSESKTLDVKFGTATDSDLKSTDWGINVGIGLEFKKFLLRTQYGFGLTNLDPENRVEQAAHYRVIGISVGYLFGGK